MAITISVGSGKGGTGKSMVLSNLALQLARSGRKVCLVDLDLGGPDAHILYGLFKPKRTLTDFLNRRVDSITDTIHTFPAFGGLQIIPGTGDTLQTANMTYQQKQRLLRSLSRIDTDVLLVDVGAGTSYHTLDFFMFTDIQICVTSPEPTAILDFYNFLQLATIRRALSSFLSQADVAKEIREKKFDSLLEVLDMAEEVQPGAREKAQLALATFNPLLIVNKVGAGTRLNLLKLRKMASQYLGIYLPDLGEIPYDMKVYEAMRAYLPVSELDPAAPASKALIEASIKLGKVIDLFIRKQSEQQTIQENEKQL
ncbi:P-loop NTPase [Desulfopila sp. IMCC35008]|uniref:MinD/ParA family ATP-binding protein n=1 Tax=Desulfopila sp. IMCC35008 TaxID=2653858 RepID=UPI0013D23515|nr:P-loop NTPase [Desulfopila sp. IMCC35008]